jgi:hypothetical protein
MGSWSADTMVGPCLARASTCTRCLNLVSALLASRMTSPRLKGDGSTGGVCAAAAVGQVVAHAVRRRANRRSVNCS